VAIYIYEQVSIHIVVVLEEAYHSSCKCTRRSYGLVSPIIPCFGDARC